MTNTNGGDMTEENNWRNNPTIDPPVWERDDVEWHDTGTLSDGTRVGKLGALWYVLDAQDRAISDGYHEIHVDGDGLTGKRGSTYEPVTYHGEES